MIAMSNSYKTSFFSEDLKKYYFIHCGSHHPPFKNRFFLWITSQGLHCVAIYRFGAYLRKMTGFKKKITLPLLVVQKVFTVYVKMIHHVFIHADIGPGFYIGHAGGIHIGPIVIGKNFSVTHNVTIGIGYRNGVAGLPKIIGNNVWIGTSSVISGPVKLGDNVTISAGSILSKDAPDNSLVAGNPARIIMNNYDNSYLFGTENMGITEK